MSSTQRMYSLLMLLHFSFNLLILAEFVVNVKSHNGNILKQTIKENVTESLITLEFEDWDLTKYSQILDFKSGINLYAVTVFGEIDAGQPPLQTLCFVTTLNKDDFIEPDAMSKLRQRNQDAIRVSEISHGTVIVVMDKTVLYDKSDRISPLIKTHCSAGAVYTTGLDIARTSEVYQRNLVNMLSSTKNLSSFSLARCHQTSSRYQPCLCSYQFSIDWYPCSLKYCKDPSSPIDNPTNIKCGIKTCSVAKIFQFAVDSSDRCWWEWFSPITP